MKIKSALILVMAGVLCLPGCATQQKPTAVANAGSPEAASRSVVKRHTNAYTYNPGAVLPDLKKVKSEYDRLTGNVRKGSGEKWGESESRLLPTRKRYVKYTGNYKSRVVVDFEAGTVLVEHLDEADAKEKLRSAAVVALLASDDPGAVDLFSDKEVVLGGTPFLQELVVDQDNVVLKSREDIDRYTDYLVNNKLQSRTIKVKGLSRIVLYVKMNMVNSHVDRRALKYAEAIRKWAADTQVSRSLVFAIISTESSFNPYAVSSVPAYGMMQLVPSGSGREAYRKDKGEDVMPGVDYLFSADNNIELGVTYLSVLLNDTPLSQIRNEVAREYCAIAAYRVGPENVFHFFSKLSGEAGQKDALDKISSMSPDKVYHTLRTSLPDAERRYLVHVVEAKGHYATM